MIPDALILLTPQRFQNFNVRYNNEVFNNFLQLFHEEAPCLFPVYAKFSEAKHGCPCYFQIWQENMASFAKQIQVCW